VTPASDLNLVAAVEAEMAAAESALREGELQIAESRYRDVLMRGWMLIGALEMSDRRLPAARDAFRRAAASAVDAAAAQQSLAIVSLQTGETAEAVALLTRISHASPKDAELRRLLAQALVADGRPEQAVQTLEEARRVLPHDLELAFTLASGYLRMKNPDAATRIFEEIAAARPLPQTDVLIGRTYRDFGEYGRAREALARALAKNPRVRRAHYYLGTIAIMEEGFARLDEAAAAFRRELRVAPNDPPTNLRLGIVLEEAKQHVEALPHLELAARADGAGTEEFEYLGRCLLALGETERASGLLQRALDTAAARGTTLEASRIGRIHYQLATALRALGRADEASQHFAQAERSSELRADTARDRLAQYLADTPDAADGIDAARAAVITPPPFAERAPDERATIRARLNQILARAHLNLGIMQMRAERFGRAAEFFEAAAAASPDFPQVQSSLGIAYFNAARYADAIAPLERAAGEDPANGDLRRMLALASLHAGQFEKASTLLASDPGRSTDPSLQYAYGLALVRGGRAAEAERVFSQLLTAHGDSPEVNVVLGQAHAQQGNIEQAIAALQRAIAARPDVADANTTLGIIYLKQGKLDLADAALHAALASHPGDVRARHSLAAVLDMLGRPEEAVSHLRIVVRTSPDMADGHYLLGKVLLSLGNGSEAAAALERAAQLAPDDANVHFQLAQAYERTGRPDLAQRAFDRYRQLKDKARGGAS
jgi:tetratricopeptide (TPR) repeat protein